MAKEKRKSLSEQEIGLFLIKLQKNVKGEVNSVLKGVGVSYSK